MMTKIFCDRGGKEIEIKDGFYYTINIQLNNFTPSLAYSLYNLNQKADSVMPTKPQYCQNYIDEIKSFIERKEG